MEYIRDITGDLVLLDTPRSSWNFFALQKVQTFIIELIRRDGWS